MTHLLMQDHDLLECEDFSYSEGSGIYQFYDHAEGERVRLTQSEFIESLACSLLHEEETEVIQYHRDLAVNIFANSTRTGRAAFLYGMMP